MFDNAIRLGSERCDKRAVPDTNSTSHLLSKQKWRSRQNGRDRITDRAGECSLASETTGRSPCREPCPSRLAERHFNTEGLERPDYVFKGPSLIG
jgi:hypothetical protein